MIPKRKPCTPGTVLKKEFLEELELSQQALADLMGVSRKTVNELVNDKQSFTVEICFVLQKVFGTSPEFWLNLQRQVDIWNAANSDKTLKRVARASAYKKALKNKGRKKQSAA